MGSNRNKSAAPGQKRNLMSAAYKHRNEHTAEIGDNDIYEDDESSGDDEDDL